MKTPLRLLLVSTALLLPFGCGLGKSSSTSSSDVAAARSGAARQPSGSAQAGTAGPAASGSPSKTNPAVGANPAQLPEGTRVQRSAQLTLQVAHGRFGEAINRVLALVDSEGGFVAGVGPQPADAAPDVRTGQISFQVPTARFDESLVALRKQGEVRQFAVSGTDVSTQYVDLQSRLASAQAERDAFLALLNRAQSIQDIVTLQNQLAPIVAQIEQLKGQIDNLDRTTTYGTITATIVEAAAAGTTPSDSWGLSSSLVQGLHNFAMAVGLIVVVLATVGPFLVLAGLGFLGWRTWERRRRAAVASPSA
jgi:Domain of unknown function (DUF4349)